MRPDPNSAPELDKLAADLAQLVPRHTLDRDGLLYAAGKASAGRRYRRVYGWSMAATTTLVALMALYWVTRPTARATVTPTVDGAAPISSGVGVLGPGRLPATTEGVAGAEPANHSAAPKSPGVFSAHWRLLRDWLRDEGE